MTGRFAGVARLGFGNTGVTEATEGVRTEAIDGARTEAIDGARTEAIGVRIRAPASHGFLRGIWPRCGKRVLARVCCWCTGTL